MSTAEARSSRKLDQSLFTWIVGLIFTVMLTLCGYLFNEVRSLRIDMASSITALEGEIKAAKERSQDTREMLIRVETTLQGIKDDTREIPKRR